MTKLPNIPAPQLAPSSQLDQSERTNQSKSVPPQEPPKKEETA